MSAADPKREEERTAERTIVAGPAFPALVWLQAARPKTLPAAISPVLLGTALAVEAGVSHAPAFLCALLGAVLIQVGTNLANDYKDFERGADTQSRLGPQRVTQAGLLSATAVKRGAALAFGLAFLAGLYLVARGGWPILVLGLVSILSGVAYTAGKYALAYTGLADLFVLVFFGPVAVGGTYYVQALALPPHVVVAGLGPGFLATAILLANNVRDVNEDRRAGKRTLVVRFGRSFGELAYIACISGAAAIPVPFVLWRGESLWILTTTALVLAAGIPLARTLRRSRDPQVLNSLLGATAGLLLGYCVIFGGAWLIG